MPIGKAGVCPCCKGWVDYGDSDNQGDYIKYDWTCPQCGAVGCQFDAVVFDSMLVDKYGLSEMKPNLITPDV